MRQSAVVSVAVLVVRLSGFLPITILRQAYQKGMFREPFRLETQLPSSSTIRIPWSLLLAEQTCSKARHEGVAAMKVWESGDEGNA
jgi:hypothetical protein